MIDYYDGQLTDLLPGNVKNDPVIQAYSAALQCGTRLIYHYAQTVYIYCSIDTAPEEILDYLAVELRTQYYSEDLDIETKRSLVRNTLLWYMTAGTPAAVEELVEIVFGYGEVQEWFEYDGEPYWFKIVTDTPLGEDNVAYFSEMVKRVKNTRSHLGSISVHREADLDFYAGVGGHSSYHPAAVRDGYKVTEETDQTINVGMASMSKYKSIVKEE
ncbi:MAG: phage tail protein I [Coprobacillus sp.]|nr:phage tail protein I [Coprobacillus sp.]